ncbi:S-adenosyl-L-methionine-dependent methyltransferase [Pisolithus orientalis]|uniref:S-adenosyl-L-methionine-dependent methyltransferase n=1 Tax=Pisolithus orientalis TaxID=936130 RepID=UPI00222534F4|nr:S-adenosyl-L-methionine-dependent methyltransferase [Pisolithus orientalis]KAI6006195.1 S-adenosyl-L-methionine-dependent methyltransferase [Pisolithus orientalis]
MRPSSPCEHICSRREQFASRLAAVSAFSGLFLRGSNRARKEHCSYDAFHFSRIEQGDSLPNAMARHQHILFGQLCLRPKKRVLAVACGNGTVSRQLVHFSDVDVIGIDTDSRLISRARTAAEEAGLTDRLTYHHVGDLCEALTNFPDCSFDAVFAIELGYRITSPKMFYKHVKRILKPSGRLAIYEWCFTDAMTPTNPEHVVVAQNLLQSFPKTVQENPLSTIADLIANLRAGGLVNVTARDLSLCHTDIPWYRPLESQQSTRSSPSVSLSWWHGQLSSRALLTAGRLQIFSPMVLVTGEKGPSF